MHVTASNVRDHVIVSLALGTGLRLAETIGLNVGDVCAPVLLDGMSADTKPFVDAKLSELAVERRRLQSRLDTLKAAPYAPIDAEVVLRDGLAALADLPRLLESANLEERKEFVQAFIGGVTVRPDEARLDI